MKSPHSYMILSCLGGYGSTAFENATVLYTINALLAQILRYVPSIAE